ncbi:MAG TPA: FtsX-like permease family protein [Puia sp.]|jgi:ABC-type antimicrobial peptide transport system permease subunit|nr:FtsX-like permease family protein [Puia sp.]
MFRNYLFIAWRNLIRNKLHTTINLGGLVIGFTIGIAVLAVVYSQLTFNGFNVNRAKIYQAYDFSNHAEGEQINNLFGLAAGPVFKAEAPAIEKMTRFVDGGSHMIYKDKVLEMPVMMADEDLFSMFSFTILKGDRRHPLGKLTDVVLTESAALKIFGREDPIGQRLKASAGDRLQVYSVSAVIKDIKQSSVSFEMLTRIENRSNYASDRNNWDNHGHVVYVQLKDGATQQEAERQLRTIDHKYLPNTYTDLAKKGAKPDKYGDVFATRLLPLDEVHFSTRVNGHKATPYTLIYTLLIIGLLIIAIASFNYVNINLATAFTRSKEIGVRKCLGARGNRLFVQLWNESFLVCLSAFLLSLLLTNILVHNIDGIQRMNVDFSEILLRPGFLLLALALLLFVSLIAGGYPSWVMSRFNAVDTLKGKLNLKRSSGLRSGLIVVQFVIACIMITCTFVVYRQFTHLQEADTGIDKNFVISVPLHDTGKGSVIVEKLREMLATDPHILSVSGSNINMGRGADRKTSQTGIGFDYKGRSVQTDFASIDYDYLKTFGIRLIEGRDFDRSYGTDTANNVLISESMAQQLGEKNVVGTTIAVDSGQAGWHVVGVFADFHLYTMEQKLEPLTLTLNKGGSIEYCFIKTTPVDALGTMETIKKKMAILEPGQDFRGSFVDENINNWYVQERTMSIFFSIAAAVAIVLSCTGLLAMVLLIVNQRVKEIGIRKVLGASVGNISYLISREFLILVGLAVVISTPVSWLVMSKWLQDFPYRINLQWWMFALVGVTALGLALLTVGFHVVRAALANPVKNLRAE